MEFSWLTTEEARLAASIRISPDDKKVGWVSHAGDKWWVVVDGKEEKAYDSLSPLRFGQDDKQHMSLVRTISGRPSSMGSERNRTTKSVILSLVPIASGWLI
jgi:hypothetical protein